MQAQIPFAEIIYTDSTKVDALNQLSNPTILFGERNTPYCILFHDRVGDSAFNGGIACIYGYTYSDDKYGVQLSLKYGVPTKLQVRSKVNVAWSAWAAL